MRMNLKQTKLIGLTMELELKTRDYKMLCEKLEKLKKDNIDANDPKLLSIRDEFIKNYNEIVEIDRQIKEIEELEEIQQTSEQNYYNDVFKNKTKTGSNNEKLDMIVVDEKKNILVSIFEKIKKMISK